MSYIQAPVALTDAVAHDYAIQTIKAKNEQILVSIVNTLDTAVTVDLLGANFDDPTMASPVIDSSVTLGAGSGTPTTGALQSDSKWRYARLRFTAAPTPTTGDVRACLYTEKQRR